jgi:hypothetical protein
MDPSFTHPLIVVDARGPGEWIVSLRGGDRSLHVYRLAPADWLVSEVGRANEGRGIDLRQAIAALSPGVPSPDWWSLAARALEESEEP